VYELAVSHEEVIPNSFTRLCNVASLKTLRETCDVRSGPTLARVRTKRTRVASVCCCALLGVQDGVSPAFCVRESEEQHVQGGGDPGGSFSLRCMRACASWWLPTGSCPVHISFWHTHSHSHTLLLLPLSGRLTGLAPRTHHAAALRNGNVARRLQTIAKSIGLPVEQLVKVGHTHSPTTLARSHTCQASPTGPSARPPARLACTRLVHLATTTSPVPLRLCAQHTRMSRRSGIG
jgi:hypothetical protein